jgi:hypothetical protein
MCGTVILALPLPPTATPAAIGMAIPVQIWVMVIASLALSGTDFRVYTLEVHPVVVRITRCGVVCIVSNATLAVDNTIASLATHGTATLASKPPQPLARPVPNR